MTRFIVALAICGAMLAPSPARGLSTGAPVEKRVAVLLLNFANQPSEPWTKAAVRDLYFGEIGSVAAYYDELSGGQLSVTGSVFGYLTIKASRSKCYIGDWAELARKAARRQGVAVGDFTNIVYIFPYQRSCWWNGFAGDVGGPEGRDSWINGLLSLYVAVHELGHNFGVSHAASLTCTSGGARVAFSSNCSSYEYGDPYDVMGYGGSRLMHAWHRWQLGMLPVSQVQTVTASGSYHLSPVELAGSGPRMLRIPRPNGGHYFLEIRQPFGAFDDFAEQAPPVNGVSVRTASAKDEANTKLIDNAPETCTFNDAPLPAGETFRDSINKITITTIAIDSDGADVQIQIGGATAAEARANSITGVAATDSSPPSSIPRVNVTQVTGKLVAVNWPAADDDVGVDQYLVSVDGEPVGTTCDLMLRGVQLKDGRIYQVGVQAVDDAGNVGPVQTTSYAVPDFTSPTLPDQLSATKRETSTSLRWAAGADNVAITKYRVMRNGAVIAELDSGARSYVDKAVIAGTSKYSVVAFDGAGNASRPARDTVQR